MASRNMLGRALHVSADRERENSGIEAVNVVNHLPGHLSFCRVVRRAGTELDGGCFQLSVVFLKGLGPLLGGRVQSQSTTNVLLHCCS